MVRYYTYALSMDKNIPEISCVGQCYAPDLTAIADIVLDTATVVKYKQRGMFVIATNEKPAIVITKHKLDNLQAGFPTDIFSLYHEMGHIALGHFSNNWKKSKKTRQQYVDGGEIMPEELQADIFAAEQLGYDNAISSLQELLKERQLWNASVKQFSATNVFAVKELMLRVRSLKTIVSKNLDT